MPWTIASVTIHPDSKEDSGSVQAFYAIQPVLDATEENITFYGAGSERKSLSFVMYEDENSNTGLTTLISYVRSDTNRALVNDYGSAGNWRLTSLKWDRIQALGHTNPVYHCVAEMIRV